MLRTVYISTLALLLFSACSRERESAAGGEDEPIPSPTKTVPVAFAAENSDISVQVFGEKAGNFVYVKTLDGRGDADGRFSVQLPVGKYEYLFLKSPFRYTEPVAVPQAGTTGFDDFRIAAKSDPDNPGYLLPADEVYFQDPTENPDSVYTLPASDTIRCKLKRAVGQIVLLLKRGYYDGSAYRELPYAQDSDILQNIGRIRMEIAGAGNRLGLAGSEGTGSIRHDFPEPTAENITDDGFALLTGPFVFPPQAGQNLTVSTTLTPKTGSGYPVLNNEITAPLGRNMRLEITLWLTVSHQFIGITTETAPITETTEGDTGPWE